MLPLPHRVINVNINRPFRAKSIRNLPEQRSAMFVYILYQKLETGRRATVALVVSWQNKVGDRQRGDGREEADDE